MRVESPPLRAAPARGRSDKGGLAAQPPTLFALPSPSGRPAETSRVRAPASTSLPQSFRAEGVSRNCAGSRASPSVLEPDRANPTRRPWPAELEQQRGATTGVTGHAARDEVRRVAGGTAQRQGCAMVDLASARPPAQRPLAIPARPLVTLQNLQAQPPPPSRVIRPLPHQTESGSINPQPAAYVKSVCKRP